MGKTVESYRMALESEISRWNGFVRALRKDDWEAFEEIKDMCRGYASEADNATNPILHHEHFAGAAEEDNGARKETKHKPPSSYHTSTKKPEKLTWKCSRIRGAIEVGLLPDFRWC